MFTKENIEIHSEIDKTIKNELKSIINYKLHNQIICTQTMNYVSPDEDSIYHDKCEIKWNYDLLLDLFCYRPENVETLLENIKNHFVHDISYVNIIFSSDNAITLLYEFFVSIINTIPNIHLWNVLKTQENYNVMLQQLRLFKYYKQFKHMKTLNIVTQKKQIYELILDNWNLFIYILAHSYDECIFIGKDYFDNKDLYIEKLIKNEK